MSVSTVTTTRDGGIKEAEVEPDRVFWGQSYEFTFLIVRFGKDEKVVYDSKSERKHLAWTTEDK